VKSRIAVVVASIALLMSVAACGDDDDDSSGPGPSGSETPEATGTAQSEPFDPDAELTIYSGRREPLFQPVVDLFEEETGIDVSVKYGGTTELGAALLEESGNPQADVFVGTGADSAEALREMGAFDTFESEVLTDVPEGYRSSDDTWVGISGRSRIIMYNSELVEEDEIPLPDSVFDLTEETYEDHIAIASTLDAEVTAWVSALRLFLGDEEAQAYLEDLQDNGIEVLRNHTEVRDAVGRGETAFGLVNHYYYELEKAEGSPVAAIYPDQAEDEMGILVNVVAAAIVRDARHREEAERFMEFLLSPEAQELFAATNYEYPVIPGLSTRAERGPDDFKQFEVDLAELGGLHESTLDMLDEIGFQ
jgi:iron(III) transport system substrate-binding protein